jgi:hypothetical protein
VATNWSDERWIKASFDGEDTRSLERWTSPCPDGRPQRAAVCLGYRERDPGRLQLRVALSGHEGVCDVIVEEDDDRVRVRLLVCCEEEITEENDDHEFSNCPVHVYLEKQLGARTVIDVQTGEPVTLFVPTWG